MGAHQPSLQNKHFENSSVLSEVLPGLCFVMCEVQFHRITEAFEGLRVTKGSLEGVQVHMMYFYYRGLCIVLSQI